MQQSNKSRKSRNIVNPTQWTQSEVSNVAEARIQPQSVPGKRGDARVTSIRSSLFKRAAQNATGMSGPSSQANGAECAIFRTADDAGDLDHPVAASASISLQMCEYGRKGINTLWVKDVFALMHNGIRHEMGDLCVILRAFKNIRENLTVGDFSDFRGWWQTFAEVVQDYLSIEEHILVPWCQTALNGCKSNDEKATSILNASIARRESISNDMQQIEQHLDMLCKCIAPGSRAPPIPVKTLAITIIELSDKAVANIADYFWDEENDLPSMLSHYYVDEKLDRENILESVLRHMTRGEARRLDEFIVLQTRWMTDQKVAKAHIKFLQTLHDFSTNKMNSQFELQHAGLVAVFKVKGHIE